MNTTPETDVLICGAGAAGLALALELARRGIAFVLIDKLAQPFPGSRGKGVAPRSQEIYEDLEMIDRLVARGGFYPPQREYAADGSYVERTPPRLSTPAEPYQIPLMVPQFIMESVFRERLAEFGRRVRFGVELVGFEQDASGVSARLVTQQGDEPLRTKYLVGADGGRSFIRHALKIGFPGETLGVRAVVADVCLEGLTRAASHSFHDGDMGRQLSLTPLAGTDMFQFQAPIPLEGEVDLSAEGVNRMTLERTGRTDITISRVAWASAFNMNARLADRYRDGRIFLVGDAAHIHPPTGGQGLNTSVQDSYNLGWKLAAVLAGTDPALLDSYEEERRPIAASVLGLSTKLLDQMKTGGRRRGRETHQLDLAYSGTALALEKPQRAADLRAGDRAPDAPVLGAGGLPTRIFCLLRGPHWSLFGYEVEPGTAIEARENLRIHTFGVGGDLIDDGGHFLAAYGLTPGDWVLVRPDGYIGAILSAAHLSDLEAYLSAVGLTAAAA